MMELAIKTMTAERRIGSQRAERETIRSLLWARMNDRVVRGEAISSLEPRSRSGMQSALHGLKWLGAVSEWLCGSASAFRPQEVAARRALLTLEFVRARLQFLA